MTRASTKSAAPAKTGKAVKGKVASSSFGVAVQDGSTQNGELSAGVWRIAGLSILVMAVLLRVYKLTLKPLHHDEGVNGFFLKRLFSEGFYQYDPGNYHGPTVYYFALISSYLFGFNTFAIRVVTVIFGVATVWLALCLRRYIGTVGALTAAGLLAISPGAVYLSRYFIHESLVVFFTFAIVVAALKYSEGPPPETESKSTGWIAVTAGVLLVASALGAVYKPQFFRTELLLMMVSFVVVVQTLWSYDGRRSVYLILAAVSAALLFATKETALVSVIVLVLALIVTAVYFRLKRKPEGESKKKRDYRSTRAGQTPGWFQTTMLRFGGPAHFGRMLFVALTIFVFVNVLFYSSFFTNAKGVGDSLQTFVLWAKTGKQEHVHPLHQHAYWLLLKESPTLLLGLLGAYLAVVRPSNRFALFAAQWGFGLLAAYSIVPYKTPWLVLNFIIPLAIAGGFAANEIYKWSKGDDQRFLVIVLLVALAVSGYQTIQLNFFHYDDEKYVYVYGHTYREFLPLVDEINAIAHKTDLKTELDVAVLSPDYWPLPWYLRNYSRVGYYGEASPTNSSVVIINESQESTLLPTLETRYQRIKSYPLRPGVVLVLYVRKDLNLN